MQNKIIAFSLDLFRLSANTREDVITILNRMERELVSNLRNSDLTATSKARTNELLRQSRETMAKYYKDSQRELFDVTEGIPQVAVKSTQNALSSVLPPGYAVALPSETVMSVIASNAVIEGAPIKAWWAKQEADVAFRYAQQVRQGLAASETNHQIIARVRGVMDISRRNAAGLVQTSTSTVANDARLVAFEANEDVIDYYIWITALDDKVCAAFCMPRADKRWKPNGDPIGHDIPFSNPPIHINDRCYLSAKTKTFKELGSDLPEPKKGTRASVDGQVPASTTLEDFLKGRTQAQNERTFGVGRAELFRDGKISLSNLIDGNQNPLTLKELVELHG